MEEKQTKKEEEEFDSYTYRFYDASKIYMAADSCITLYLIRKNCFVWISGTF